MQIGLMCAVLFSFMAFLMQVNKQEDIINEKMKSLKPPGKRSIIA
jgi:hypothetical protein